MVAPSEIPEEFFLTVNLQVYCILQFCVMFEVFWQQLLIISLYSTMPNHRNVIYERKDIKTLFCSSQKQKYESFFVLLQKVTGDWSKNQSR